MILTGDAITMLKTLDDESAQCCVTSPPYWGLRDYGADGQLGLEATPDEYAANMVAVFREVRRVLKNDGTLWLNLGDSYATGAGSGRAMGGKCFGKTNAVIDAGSFPKSQPNRMSIPGLKPKDLVGIPWLVAFALRADGWYLRSDIIWAKPNPMPESVRDRPTKSHEYIFLLAKSEKYFYDADAVKEPATDKRGPGNKKPVRLPDGFVAGKSASTRGRLHEIGKRTERNMRTVWRITTTPFPGAHFATFPRKLITPCILAGSRAGDTVLDPFSGAATTGLVAMAHRRKYIGIEINPAYVAMSNERLSQIQLEAFV